MGSPASRNEAFNDSNIMSNSVKSETTTTCSIENRKENVQSEKPEEPAEFELEKQTVIEPAPEPERIKTPSPFKIDEKTSENTSIISNSPPPSPQVSLKNTNNLSILINHPVAPSDFASIKSNSPLASPPVALKNANPSPPPRVKKKYNKRSVTTDLSRYIVRKVSDSDSLESDSIEDTCFNKPIEHLTDPGQNTISYLFKPLAPPIESSLVADRISTDELGDLISKITDLNDSLEGETKLEESLITRLVGMDHSELNREEDSLVAASTFEIQQQKVEISKPKPKAKRAQWDKSNDLNFSKRAEWDKTRQEIDLMYFNFSMKSAQNAALRSKQQSELDAKKSTSNSRSVSSSKPADSVMKMPQQTPKKTRNLNLAKEKLYEMKLNLDLMNSSVASGKPTPKVTDPGNNSSNHVQRTTPRKVKKRSGERSFTTGLFADSSRDKSTENLSYKQRPQLNPTPLRSRSPFMASNNSINSQLKSTPTTARKNSSSLHNISRILNESTDNNSTGRERTDSYTSTISNCTFSGFSQPAYEYKETKSSELRKKAAIMNKIGSKGSQFDTIYSRNHPTSAHINSEKVNFTLDDQSTAARKRLFAKKSEKNTIYDPNMSICSNNSSISSSGTTNSSVPTSSSMSFSNNNNQRQSRPEKVFDHVQHNIKLYSSNKTSLKVGQTFLYIY